MKNIYLFIFVSSINFLYSQTPKEYKNKDTIYILYDKNEKFDDLHTENEVGKFSEIYKYVFPDAKIIMFNINLNMSVPFPSVIKKKRCYLDNKSLITFNEIHNLGYNKLLFLLDYNNLTVFLIDKKYLKKKKIIMKQATLSNIRIIDNE